MEKKLYSVHLLVDVHIEIEADNFEDAAQEAKESLVNRGVYELSPSVGMFVDSVEEVL